VTGITISREQLQWAQQRVSEAGLQDRIELQYCDYRHIEGQYDKLVSIEMLEAVGHAGLGPFFKACHGALKPGGRGIVQVITIPDRKYNTYRYSSDWIRKHIFPGGHVPSLGAMQEAIRDNSELSLDGVDGYAADYAETLERWRQTLLEKRDEIKAMGFDENFIRKWEYYFAYCHAGFKAEIIDLLQMVLNKPKSR
jgi:cyclopropane-fatty-acyl-phospholipid synthase